MTKRIALASAVIVAASGMLAAQPRPAFAVASVKPTGPDSRDFGIQFLPGGRLVIKGYPLHMIVASAYGLPFQSTRLKGGPDWIRRERYDIEATAEKDAMPAGLTGVERARRMRQMLQALLADRFKLAIQSESKDLSIFALVVAKDGPKLERAAIEEKDCPESGGTITCHAFRGGQGRGMHGEAVDMSDLAGYVENWTERPVVDQTGLKGLYRVDTTPWIAIRPGPAPAAGAKGEDGTAMADLPDIFGVFTRMGLKLEARKAPVEIFEITRIERPAGN